jgi:hypothetical protein
VRGGQRSEDGEGKGKGMEKKHRFGKDEHEKRKSRAGFEALRYVDDEGNVFAEYRNEVGLPAPHKEELWGTVSLRSRAVLLEDGVDRAFVTLAALLETYVKMFGGSQRPDREWGNLTGSMVCNVM